MHSVRDRSVFCCKILCLFLMALFLFLQPSRPVSAKSETPDVHLCYFYVNLCTSCRDVDETLDDFRNQLEAEQGPTILIHAYNIAEPDSLARLQHYCAEYNVPEDQRKAPLLFSGTEYYQGAAEIERGLKQTAVLIKQGHVPELLVELSESDDADRLVVVEQFQAMRAAQVSLAGLINGLNPCSLSMLLFFLSLLLARKKTNVLALGGAFLAAKFATYLLLGTAFYSFFSRIDSTVFNIVMNLVMALFVLFLVALNLRDFYYARQEKYGQIKNQLPGTLRRFNHLIISTTQKIEGNAILLAASAGLGIVITMGEFLCTGQIYLATILYMVQDGSALSGLALTYLVLYVAFFLIPSIIVLLLLSGTRRLMAVSTIIQNHLPAVKLATAATMLLIGIVVIFS